MQQLSARRVLAKQSESLARLVETFCARRISCGLLEFARLDGSLVVARIFRTPARLRQTLARENIYTPEFVLNGQEWRNWLGLRGASSVSDVDAGVLEINSTNGVRWNASFAPTGGTKGAYEIHAALLVGGLSSEVKAGENRGRTLPHEFTVVELVHLGLTSSNGVADGRFILNTARHSSKKIWPSPSGSHTLANLRRCRRPAAGWLRLRQKSKFF